MDKCCALFGYSRQAYYKHSAVKNFDTEAANELILQSVRQHREMMPPIGSRKLYVLAQHEQGSLVGFPGRDRFIDLLASNDLLLKLRRRKRYKTTDSNHPYRRYLNLIKDLEFHGPNEGLFGVNQIRSLQKLSTVLGKNQETVYLFSHTAGNSQPISGKITAARTSHAIP